ncbi:DNA-3-methyladenine glycosylase family protein [Parvimonas micra]|uniref:DNA-(apurinic or apyrimidinic site) lyase n=1 Tax=Parvimonas micra ATCC 33270 TaxID=411465 RepID=A8SM23_9FIRM|nr:DNA glycosylase [Parvimonas micra]EDP23372.1 8-oxoguanine DNA-glycosylase (ogg) [Parvimonas micra ATCC 33270]RSB90791.1 8-oxoguanine DNA glycosylase [Parvimonas micra]VEH97928.1 3-methyladenine DNA glycosylase [Parvimonas micra]
MKLYEKDNSIILEEIENFDAKAIFTCGQAFRWYEESDGSFTTVHLGRVLNVLNEKDRVIFKGTNLKEFDEIWMDYFDLNTDYKEIRKVLSNNEILPKAMEYGEGIRILNQNHFEMLISFIISANNMIPRIKKSIEVISMRYGKFICEDENRKYYSFPTVEELSRATVEDLRKFAKVGFRDKRIFDTVNMILNEKIDLDNFENLETDILREELLKFSGVGNKVADCIMLFSYKRGEVFPVDVWIKRVMEELFIKKETPVKKISKEADRIFGKYAGYAQQYLFYYGREEKIGK